MFSSFVFHASPYEWVEQGVSEGVEKRLEEEAIDVYDHIDLFELRQTYLTAT